MYSFTSRIRFSEVDTHLNLTLGSVIDYFQDCSTFHSEAVGMNIARLSAMKRAWILSSWQIVPVRFPKLGEKVTISTWPYDFHGFFGYRNFTMTGEDGECLVYANSIWIYMDTETGRPCSAVSSCPIICVAQSCATPMRIMSFSARVAASIYSDITA